MLDQNMPYIEEVTELVSRERSQYLIFVALSIGVLAFTGILYLSDNLTFQRFLGQANPLIVFLFAAILGFFLLSFLLSQNWFVIYEKENLKEIIRSATLAALLGTVMILVDTKIIFSADTNILFPKSLLFYPAIAFLVDILFHVLPLTVLLLIMNSILRNAGFETVFWICLLIVAFLEPAYQVVNMGSSNHFPGWAVAYIGIHIFLINIFQLLIFRQHGFISMYLFRLVYYSFWHVGWGILRLELLF